MPSPAAITIYIFGLSSLLAGLFSLADPSAGAAQLSFPVSCVAVWNGNSLAATAMGIYYTLAAYQENEAFFALTVPMRLLTTAVFWNQGWTTPAIWEGAGAMLTAGALASGSRKGKGRTI